MMYDKIAVIHARDHFSTAEEYENECIAQFVGVISGEDETYLELRHIKADVVKHDSGEEFHKIVKSAIIDRQEFEFVPFLIKMSQSSD